MKVDLRIKEAGQVITVEKLRGDVVFNAAELRALSDSDRARLMAEVLESLIGKLEKIPLTPAQEAARGKLVQQATEIRETANTDKKAAASKAESFLSTLRSCFGDVAEIVLTAVQVIQSVRMI